MNKDEIVAASDAELNEWCASVIMGYERKHNQFSSPPDWWALGGYGVMPIEQYAPTDNIKQAITLLDHLHATKTLDDWGITRFPKYYICSITCPHPSIPKQILAINHAHKEMCRAIVFACLLMVTELGEQQTAAEVSKEPVS